MTVVDYRSPQPHIAPTAPPHVNPVNVWELIALAVLFGVYLVTMAVVGDQGTFAVNLLGPAAFSIILAIGVVPSAMRDANIIWTPLFWFRVAATVYFGFGNLVPFLLNSASQESLARYFNEYLDLITKLNAVSALGMLLALASAFTVDLMLYQNRRAAGAKSGPPTAKEQRNLLTLAIIFVGVGLFIKLVFVLPTSLGVNESLLPGSVSSLAMLSDAGIYMLAVWAWNYRPSMVFIAFALAALEVFFGLLEFNKSEVIAPILVVALGWLSKGVTVRRMLITTGTLATAFALIVPFVTSGRDEMLSRYHSLGGAGLAERMEIAGYYFQPSNKDSGDLQTGLLRFSYVSSATFALSLYDSGDPGGTLATLPAAFVPRVLWPDKPNMTIIGSEFNEKATGNAQSASSSGWIAEAYWDYGWLGLPLIMIPLGAILQIWSEFSLSVMRSGKWMYFPLCLLGMKAGISVDGFVVPNLMGPVVMTLVAYAGLRVFEQIYSRTSMEAAPISSRPM